MTDANPICYSLTRRQRLIPHLKIWGPLYVPFALMLLGFFAIRTAFAVLSLEWMAILTFGGLFVFFVFFLRGMIVGLLDALFVPTREMDITIENNGLGVMLGETRWYLFLDGITRLTEYVDGLWTVEHYNGLVLHIPRHMISDDQLTHIRERMTHGRTADGVTETVERGKCIQELTRNENRG
jgi:hypothetical protein